MKKFCIYCGQEVKAGSKFCTHCGKELNNIKGILSKIANKIDPPKDKEDSTISQNEAHSEEPVVQQSDNHSEKYTELKEEVKRLSELCESLQEEIERKNQEIDNLSSLCESLKKPVTSNNEQEKENKTEDKIEGATAADGFGHLMYLLAALLLGATSFLSILGAIIWNSIPFFISGTFTILFIVFLLIKNFATKKEGNKRAKYIFLVIELLALFGSIVGLIVGIVTSGIDPLVWVIIGLLIGGYLFAAIGFVLCHQPT